MRIIWALGLLLAAGTAQAAEHRVALLVAHPFGGDELVPLRYTANDVERMREVLTGVGGFAPANVLVSFGEDADAVSERFDEARRRLREATSEDAESLFMFYYSGHAKDGELRLGDSRLPLADVKRLTESMGASLRLAVIDACRSGSITRLKGAQKGAPIDMAVEDSAAQLGQVLITASSEHEDAQESDDIQGSFFTYFLTSGLRGAADLNDDAKVSLSEAYNHAYAHTVLRTVGTKGGVQHPTYRFDLRGAGDVTLTSLDSKTASIGFSQGASGQFVVFDLAHKVVVAEVDKQEGRELALAVPAGRYVVKKRETSHVLMQRVTVRQGEAHALDLERMEKVAFADDYAKGATVTGDEVRFGRVGLRLSGGVLAQSFLSAPARKDYFPPMALATAALDFDNLLRKNLGVRVDIGLGGSGEIPLTISDPYLGDMHYQVRMSELTTGAALVMRHAATSWLTVGGQLRLGVIVITREFIGAELPDQRFATMSPGLGAEAAVRLTDWLSASVLVRAHYMFFNVDEPQSLTYVDGALALTAVLR
jgi:hypothetical protein